MRQSGFAAAAFIGLSLTFATTPATAAACGTTAAGFGEWLAEFKQEAVRAGIPQATVNAALNGVTYDQRVIRLDRNQGHFRQSFEEFSRNRVGPRLSRARGLLQRHAGLLRRIEQRYGVPGAVIVAIWGMETDFGAGTGNMSALRSLATLAYDCRRSAMFTAELLDALRIVQRGDLSPAQMRGAWAGELGQTQFMMSSYVRFAVDFDGDGRADLIRSTPDALASTANYLRGHGWRAGQPWSEGTANFEVLRKWNRALIVAKTIAYFADRLTPGN